MKLVSFIFLLSILCLNLRAQDDSALVFKVRKPPPSAVEVRLKVDESLTRLPGTYEQLPQHYNGLTGIEQYFETNLKYEVRRGQEKATVLMRLKKDSGSYQVVVDSVWATKPELRDAVAFWTNNMANWGTVCQNNTDTVYLTMEVIFKPWQEKRPEPVRLQTFTPYPGLKPKPQQQFTFNAEDGFFHYFANGTHLSIPPHAFKNSGGDTVKGKVRVTYCDYHTIEELMARGVSTGIESKFKNTNRAIEPLDVGEVIEFRAYKNDLEVELFPKSPVLLETISDVPRTSMYIRYWNEREREWVSQLRYWDLEAGSWAGQPREDTGVPYHLDTALEKRVRLLKVKQKGDTTLFIDLDVFCNGNSFFIESGLSNLNSWLNRSGLKDLLILKRFSWKVALEDIEKAEMLLQKEIMEKQDKGFFRFTWLFPKKTTARFVDVVIEPDYDKALIKMSLLNGKDHDNVTLRVIPYNKKMEKAIDSGSFSHVYRSYIRYAKPRQDYEPYRRFDHIAKRVNFKRTREYDNRRRQLPLPDSMVRSFFIHKTGFYLSTKDGMEFPNNKYHYYKTKAPYKIGSEMRFADSIYKEISGKQVFLVFRSLNSVIIQDSVPRLMPILPYSYSNSNYNGAVIIPGADGKLYTAPWPPQCATEEMEFFDVFLSDSTPRWKTYLSTPPAASPASNSEGSTESFSGK